MNAELPEAARSDTANEYENPGANYPDREDAGDIEPESEELRSDAAADGAAGPAPDSAPRESAVPTQDVPVLAQNETTTQEQIDGVLDQVRADLGTVPVERYEAVLEQRFTESGIAVPADQVHAFAERLATGSDA